MKKSFITLAVLIALVPHLGFPQMWKDVFVSIAAMLIIVLTVIPRKETVLSMEKVTRGVSFIEGSPAYLAETGRPQSKEKEQTPSHE